MDSADRTDDTDEHPPPAVVASFATVGEAEVAVAKLAAYGIEGAVMDDLEGGTLPVQGEPGVVVAVPAVDAEAAREILTPVEGA